MTVSYFIPPCETGPVMSPHRTLRPFGGYGSSIGGFENSIGGFRVPKGGFRAGMVWKAYRKGHRQAAVPFLSVVFGPKIVFKTLPCLQSTRLNR